VPNWGALVGTFFFFYDSCPVLRHVKSGSPLLPIPCRPFSTLSEARGGEGRFYDIHLPFSFLLGDLSGLVSGFGRILNPSSLGSTASDFFSIPPLVFRRRFFLSFLGTSRFALGILRSRQGSSVSTLLFSFVLSFYQGVFRLTHSSSGPPFSQLSPKMLL